MASMLAVKGSSNTSLSTQRMDCFLILNIHVQIFIYFLKITEHIHNITVNNSRVDVFYSLFLFINLIPLTVEGAMNMQ